MPPAKKTTTQTPAKPEVIELTYEQPMYQRVIYLLLGIINGLLFFRLFFLIFGANPLNNIVDAVYQVTKPLVQPFVGMFPGIGDKGWDGSTIMAIICYTLLAQLVIYVIRPFVPNRTVQQ